MRILLVEDDPSAADSVSLFLKSEDFRVYVESLGEEAVDIAKIYEYDAIILDIDLPDISGIEVLKRLRRAKITTPVLALSGRADLSAKLDCLGAGADDYVVKPASNQELAARLRAIVRRAKGHAQSVIQMGELTVNLDMKSAETNGLRIPLSNKEYQILELLTLRRGATLTKEAFLNDLYGEIDEPDPKIIDVFICKLRKKLLLHGLRGAYIETVWGQGYTIRDWDKAVTKAA